MASTPPTTDPALLSEKQSNQINDLEKGTTAADPKKNRFSFLNAGANSKQQKRDSMSDDGTNTTATKNNGNGGHHQKDKDAAKDA
ncbi:hypothetical protein FRC19_004098, partial [Serendipita sp. 401]